MQSSVFKEKYECQWTFIRREARRQHRERNSFTVQGEIFRRLLRTVPWSGENPENIFNELYLSFLRASVVTGERILDQTRIDNQSRMLK